MKRIAGLILMVLLALCLAFHASAAENTGECGEHVAWSVDDQGTLTISGTGPMEEYFQREEDGYTLYSPPFWNWKDGNTEEVRRQIRRIVIQDGVTTVGGGAFRDLDGLESVSIPASVTYIGDFAFDNDTRLQEVAVPAAVRYIGERAFYECAALRAVNVAAGNPAYKSVDGVLFTADGREMLCYGAGRAAAAYRVPAGVEILHPSTFSYASALQSVELPESLVEIRDWAFGHTGLKAIALPTKLRTIDFAAFGYCEQLKTASIPASLVSAGEYLFVGCQALERIDYGGAQAQWNLLGIGGKDDTLLGVVIRFADASSDESLVNLVGRGSCGANLTWSLTRKGVLIISGTGAMDDYARRTDIQYDANGRRVDVSYYTYPWREFVDRIAAVQVDEGVTAIGNMAFAEMGALKAACLPQSLRRVVYGAFYNTGLTSLYYAGTKAQWNNVTLGQQNTPLNAATFHATASEDNALRLPARLGQIGDYAFANGAYTQVYLDSGVRAIGAGAFSGCAQLQYVSIPGRDVKIAEDAFDGCPNLIIGCRTDGTACQFALSHGLFYRSIG